MSLTKVFILLFIALSGSSLCQQEIRVEGTYSYHSSIKTDVINREGNEIALAQIGLKKDVIEVDRTIDTTLVGSGAVLKINRSAEVIGVYSQCGMNYGV